ncbi:MAG TPA: glycosyltransferase [Anaerolineae bacterium]|nr:glycosyltransferase [Anaerolineae bacterium]
MIDALLLPIALLYFLVSAILFTFGLNFLYLTWRAWREGRQMPPTPPPLAEWPHVTVQLPIYNEMYVAKRIIAAAVKLDYPANRLQIQVTDDSTDETREIVRQEVARWQAQGVNISHLHRTDRSGYKAGALQAAMPEATGEFIAIFDADFVPPPDFLRRTLPHFLDEKTAFVQARWGHLNRNYSWLTYLQSLAIDGHFMIEQFARSRAGFWFNFNGTAGVWRRAAMEDAGGWTADTLTEDLDLSYRAHLRGGHGRYLRDLVVPGEIPPSFSGFRKQQHRWARGSLECARKLAPQVWRAPIPFRQKFQATLHLTGYTVHLLLFVLTLIYPLVALFTARYAHLSTLYGLAYLFALTSIAPTLFFLVGQQQLGRLRWRQLPKILAISVVGSGLMLNTARAAWQIWRQPDGVFERTAKFGLEEKGQDWRRQKYQLRFDPIVYPELALGVYSLWTAWLAVSLESWGIVFYAFLFGIGLIFAAATTIWQTISVYHRQKGVKEIGDRRLEIDQSPISNL